jgi:hypothetical protein
MKQHKPWFKEGCSEVLDERKQARLHQLQNSSQINGDNLNNVRHEASRHFRSKKREYLKDKIDELSTHSKNKNVHNLYFLPHIIIRIKSGRMRWAGHGACIGRRENACRVLVGKRQLGRLRHRSEDNIKWI